MKQDFFTQVDSTLREIENANLFKKERFIASPQSSQIKLQDGSEVINMCANNYLGLADNEQIINAAKKSYDEFGYGMSSVRFICGTQTQHKTLERKLADFLGFEDSILYSSCFDANGGLFEVLLSDEDAIISDQLNHASIIDGIRLCKAKRYRYLNNDLEDLEKQLIQADKDGARHKLIATDGVFSMDGIIANLKGVCDLADKYHALVMVDDSHAVGFMGENGRGTHEFCEVMGRIDFMTGTLGKALGGASGGYIASRKSVVELLRQRSRPYLFSNTLTPSMVAASICCLDMLTETKDALNKLHANTKYFREAMTDAGFDIIEGEHPIVPVMFGEAELAQYYSTELLKHGVYAIGFFYPVVPKGKARIRIQVSAAHTTEQLQKTVEAFKSVREAQS